MGVKYYGVFDDSNNSSGQHRSYRVLFDFTGYSGAATRVQMGARAFTLDFVGNREDIVGVQELKADFELTNTLSSITSEDFFTENEKSIKVTVQRMEPPSPLTATGGTVLETVFVGYLTPRQSEDPYYAGAKTIRVSATDGIAYLKNEKFITDGGYVLDGINTWLFVFKAVLDKIGLVLPFSTVGSLRLAGQDASGTFEPMAFTNHSLERYKDKTYYEVLEAVALHWNARIQQHGGEWWLVRLYDLPETTHYRKWAANGDYISGGTYSTTQTVQGNGALAPLNGTMSYDLSVKKRVGTLKLGGYRNKLQNADFETMAGADIANWTEVNSPTVARIGTGTAVDPYKMKFTSTDDKVRPTTGYVIQEIDLGTLTEAGSLRLKTSGKCELNDVGGVSFRYTIRIYQGATLLYLFNLNDDGRWVRGGYVSINTPHIDSNGYSKKSPYTWEIVSEKIISILEAFGREEADASIFTSVILEVVFYEGIGEPKQNWLPTADKYVQYYDLKAELVDESINLNTTEVIYTLTNEAVSMKDEKDEFLFADMPYVEQDAALLNAAEGITTGNWITTGDTTERELVEHLMRERLAVYSKPPRFYDGGVRGYLHPLKAIALEAEEGLFVPLKMKYDFAAAQATGRWIRLRQPNDAGGMTMTKSVKLRDGSEQPVTGVELPSTPNKSRVNDLVPNIWDFVNQIKMNQGMVMKKNVTDDEVQFLKWESATTTDVEDWINPTAVGFELKTKDHYATVFDVSALTAAANIKIPNVSTSAVMATNETAWMLGGNTMTSENAIGTAEGSDFNVPIIKNGNTVAVFNSKGVAFPLIQEGELFEGARDFVFAGIDLAAPSKQLIKVTNSQATEYLSNYLWRLGGNTLASSQAMGSIAGDFDIPVLRNNVEVGKWRTGGLTVPNMIVSNPTIGDTSEYLQKWSYDSNWFIGLRQKHVAGSHIEHSIRQYYPTADVPLFSFKFGSIGVGIETPNRNFHVGVDSLFSENIELLEGKKLYVKANSPNVIIQGSRTDFSQLGFFSYDGWGNYTISGSFGIGYALGSYIPSNDLLVAGRIGLGTSTPTEKLDIYGTIKATGLKLPTGAVTGYVLKVTDAATGATAWQAAPVGERWKGNWDASSGVAPSDSPTEGDYYSVIEPGTYAGVTYPDNSYAYYNGTSWVFRPNGYELAIASSGTLGGVRVGLGLSIESTTGILSRNALVAADIPSLDWAKISTGKPTTVAGYGITDAYTKSEVWTKTESDLRFVHLSGDEDIDNIKNFRDSIKVSNQQLHLTEDFFNRNGNLASYGSISNKLGAGGLLLDVLSTGGLYFRTGTTKKALFDSTGLILSNSLANSDVPTERLHVVGNIRYSTTLKPNNVQGTAGTWLKNNGTGNADTWSAITHSDISNLVDYTGFDTRYYTQTASDNRYVDVLYPQDVDGVKNFLADLKAANTQIHLTEDFLNRGGTSASYGVVSNKLGAGGLILDVLSTGVVYFRVATTRKALFDTNGLMLSSSLGNTDVPTERLHVGGNIRYSGTLKPANQTPTANMWLKAPTTSTNEWAFITSADITDVNAANKLLKLNGSALIDSQFLPAYVDDVLEFANLAAFPITGETGKIYVAIDSSKQYRWSGSSYVQITDGKAVWGGIDGTLSAQTDLQSALDLKLSIATAASTYLTTTAAATTYQPKLPTGTSGQFAVRNASNEIDFMNLELEPQGLSYNKIAVGDSANYLSEYNNFEFREGRYVAIFKNADPTKAFYMGMYGTSNNSFVTASGGSLVLKGDNGIYLDGFTGFGNRMLIVDGNGKIAETTIPTGGGGGGSTSLGSELIGFGSPTNTVTGVSRFKWIGNRVIKIDNAGSSNIEIGRKFGTDNYGLFVNNGDLELFSTANVNVSLGATGQFKIGDKLKYFRNTNAIQLDSIYTAGEYLTIGNPVGDVFWINAINAKLSLSGTELALGSTEASYMTFQNCKINWDTNDCVNGWSSGGTPQEGDEVTLIFSGGEFKLKRKI